MDIVSTSPLRVASFPWERKPGDWVLTVVCKATYDLQPGEAPLAREQEHVHEHPNHWDDDPKRSLFSPGDLAPFKPHADVLLVGHAFAPRAEPALSLVARIIVGTVDKSIEVFGDRTFNQSGVLQEDKRFSKMPLRYERAAGGPDTWNPVGVPRGRRDIYGHVQVPNLQPTGMQIANLGDHMEPIGFGPLSANWPTRRERLGPRADSWIDVDWNKAPLPTEIDPRYWNAAPPDQQPSQLRDDERIILENLHPKHPRLVTQLPGIRPIAHVEREGQTGALWFIADTLFIDTDRAMVTLTWRGQMPINSPQERIAVIVSMDRTTEQPFAGAIEDPETAVGSTMDTQAPAQQPQRGGLPFAPAGAGFSAPSNQPIGRSYTAVVNPSQPPAQPSEPPKRGRFSQPTRIDLDGGSRDAAPAWLQAQTPPPSRSPIAAQPNPSLSQSQVFQPQPAPQQPQPAPVTQAPSSVTALGPAPQPPAPAPPAQVPLAASPWASNPSFGNEPRPSMPSVPPASSWGSGAPHVYAPPPPPPPSIPQTGTPGIAAAAVAGAGAASDAAARSARVEPADPPPVVLDVVPERAIRPTNEAVELLWFNPKSVKRIKSWWSKRVADAEFRDLDPRHDLPMDDPEAQKSRRAVFAVLAEEPAEDAIGITRAVDAAVDEHGHFTPPLLVAIGELRLPFDEVEQLKTIVGAVTPVIGGDKRLKESVDAVTELLKTPYLQGSGGVVQKIQQQLQEQLTQTNRTLPPNYLDLHVERALLEQRKYQKRKVFGEPHLRALLNCGGTQPIPAYLPEALAEQLPMMASLRARLIAEVVPQQDQYESSPFALRVSAVARLIRVDRRF